MGGADLTLFTLVENVLNTENVIGVNPTTGLPNISGLEFTDSRNPQIPANFLNDEVLRGYPLALTDIKEEWRDEFSRQDLNGDGTITLEEGQETAFRGYIAQSNPPLHYGAPRQIRFGAEIRF